MNQPPRNQAELGGGELLIQAARFDSFVLGSSPGTPALAPEFPRKPGVFFGSRHTARRHSCHFGCQKRDPGAILATTATVGPANYGSLRTGPGFRVAPLCHDG